jgi:hypothetical protein
LISFVIIRSVVTYFGALNKQKINLKKEKEKRQKILLVENKKISVRRVYQNA